MRKMILDIFDKINVEIPDLPRMEEDLARQVETVLENMQGKVPQRYHDEISRYFFEVSGIAERKGFELGVKYMTKLLVECLS